MAIRNPFDQVILDDPAYAEETKIDPQAGKKLVRDIYGLAVGQEDPFANQRLLRELSVGLAQREAGLPVDPNKSFVTSAERQDPVLGPALDKFNFQPMGPLEAGERTVEFLLRDQKNARDKQLRGEELTFGEKILASPFMAAIDALDVLGVSALAKRGVIKASEQGLKFLDNLIQSGASKEDIAKQFAEKFPQDANNVGLSYYKSFSDENPRVVLQKDDGSGGGARLTKEGVQSREDNTQKLIDILKQDLDVNKTKSIGQIIKDNNLEGLLKTERGKGFELKKEVRQKIVSEVPEIFKSKFAIRAQPAAELKRAETDPKLTQVLEKFVKDGTIFNSPSALSQRLDALGIVTRRAITKRLNDPNFKPFFDLLIQPKPKKKQTTDSFDKVFRQVPETNIINILSTTDAPMITVKDFNPQGFDLIKELRLSQGITGEFSPKELFKDFLEFRYRNVRDSGLFPDLTPEKFFNRKYDPEEISKIREEFKNFINLEQTRLTMQKESRDFLEELSQIPQYKKYLLDSKGQLDLKLVKVDKAHDTPLFLTRVEGAGRLKNVGRFLDQGTEPEFINPSFQAYNNLQKITDPLINKLADLRVNKTLRKQAENMDFNLSKKTKSKSGKYVVPKDRLDFVSEDMIKYLNLKGANINLDNFRNGNQLNFLDAVDKAIDKIYKDRAIRTLVPVREGKGGKKLSVFFGVKDMKAIPNEARVELFKKSLKDQLDFAVENNLEVGDFKNLNEKKGDIGFIKRLNKGGPVRMAIGGDPLQNINQQQFAPDPAMDDDFFKKAVDSGNLQAFGAGNLFKIFGKVPGLLTPKKVVSDIPTAPGTTPVVPNVNPGDFPFKSFFIESTTNPNAPKSALPKDWLKYYTGNIGVPQSEMKDAGIFNYLEDIEKFFPNTKLTQQNLIDVYESSPIANIEVKIKRQPATNTPPGSLGAYMGKPTHQGSGSQPLDSQGTNYREIVVNVDKLPGQDKPFFNSSHFGKDPNVIAFTRVADYKDVDGNTVAAIQEIQTDMLTNLKKEQERMKGTAVMIRNYKEKLKNQIAQGDTYMQDMLEKIERDYPESMLKFMETSDLVRPNNPTFADTLTPDVVKELNELQERITTIANQNRVMVVDPDFQNKIVALQEEGRQKFNKLFELNRGTNYEDQLKNIKILDVDNTEDLERFANANPTYEARFRPVQSFPVLPFNKGKDYIDLLLKATIQDAQANGINKVAIFPSELVNKRWGKDPDGPAAKKFKTIYDNITVQEMKNIAKKYTGNKNNLKIEEIVDSSKADKGLKFFNKNVDGELEFLKDFEPRGDGNSPQAIQAFLNTEIERVALDFGPNEVVLRREIAPGQTMEYFVQTKADDGFELVPLGDGDRAENATIIIDEYNPQRVKMFTLTLPEETTKKGPMFIYGKKDGGKIASDGLVSITDIFGEY